MAVPKVLVLSDDSALLDALSEGCRGRARLLVAPSLERFTDQLITVGASLLWLDCAASATPMVELIERLRAQFPMQSIMISGNGSEQRALAALLAADETLRFVHKPASATRLVMLLETALREPASLDDIQALASGGKPGARRRSSVRLLIAAALLLVMASGAWLLWGASF